MDKPRQQLGENAFALRARVAWVQRGELDRDPRPGVDPFSSCGITDGVYGIFVGGEIALCVGSGESGFAQHVVRIAITASLALARVVDRLGDGAPRDELPAEQAHREVDALSNQRLAAFAQERSHRGLQRRIAARIDELAAHEQSPCGGVDEQ